ncbi:MAG: DUF4433 domain-containing protein [Bacteroidota bacterium]
MDWAESSGTRWAFSLANAGAHYTEFRNRWDQLTEVDWAAVAARDFRNPEVKEGKQAEFLLHEFFPWHLVQRTGVISAAVQTRVLSSLAGEAHRPAVEVRRVVSLRGEGNDSLHPRRHSEGRSRGPGQYRQLRGGDGARHCASVQAGVS